MLGTLLSSAVPRRPSERDDQRGQCDDVAYHRADGAYDVRPFHVHLLSFRRKLLYQNYISYASGNAKTNLPLGLSASSEHPVTRYGGTGNAKSRTTY